MTDPHDLQADVDQLTRELAAASARADALDVRCSAAERLAIALDRVATIGDILMPPGAEADELVAALELWRRVAASHHGTRAHDYADAVTQLAEARRWVPTLNAGRLAQIERLAAGAGTTPGQWMADKVENDMYESEW